MQGENERQWKKVNENTYDISSQKRVTKTFLDVSRCSRAKQRQGNVQKRVPHVQSCFFANYCFSPFLLPSPLSITRFYILFEQTFNIMRASLLALAKSIKYILKQWIVFFARSDWLLNQWISCTIHWFTFREQKNTDELNLLLITDGEEQHYVLIKYFNQTMHNISKSYHRKHFCTVLCKRNVLFFVLCSRENSTKFRREFSLS